MRTGTTLPLGTDIRTGTAAPLGTDTEANGTWLTLQKQTPYLDISVVS